MKARSDVSIGVYGHSDNKGGKAYNQKLSQARAAACMDYLVKHGIDRNACSRKGYGPDKPIADNATEEGRAKNRRVEFKVIEGLDGDESEDGTDAEGASEPDTEGAAEGNE